MVPLIWSRAVTNHFQSTMFFAGWHTDATGARGWLRPLPKIQLKRKQCFPLARTKFDGCQRALRSGGRSEHGVPGCDGVGDGDEELLSFTASLHLMQKAKHPRWHRQPNFHNPFSSTGMNSMVFVNSTPSNFDISTLVPNHKHLQPPKTLAMDQRRRIMVAPRPDQTPPVEEPHQLTEPGTN